MATILDFRVQSLRSPGGTSRHAGSGGAEIVFFAGVRYERWSEETSLKPKAKKSRRRDTLDLED